MCFTTPILIRVQRQLLRYGSVWLYVCRIYLQWRRYVSSNRYAIASGGIHVSSGIYVHMCQVECIYVLIHVVYYVHGDICIFIYGIHVSNATLLVVVQSSTNSASTSLMELVTVHSCSCAASRTFSTLTCNTSRALSPCSSPWDV